jgi:hypothetical protein
MNTLEIRINFSCHQLYTLLECLSFPKKKTKNCFLICFLRDNINSWQWRYKMDKESDLMNRVVNLLASRSITLDNWFRPSDMHSSYKI